MQNSLSLVLKSVGLSGLLLLGEPAAFSQDQAPAADEKAPKTSEQGATDEIAAPPQADKATIKSEEDVSPEVLAQHKAFQIWLDELRKEALDKGFSEDLIKQTLSDITYAPRIVKRDRSQPEVVQTYAAYLKARVSEWRINKGREMMLEERDQLRTAADRYGVQPRFIAGIWGMETNFGTYALSHDVFGALATLAFDPRRGSRFRPEIFAAMKILEQGHVDYSEMKSSWAGAMGQPQFMPASYLRFAEDLDGDGKKDIWNNRGDVFASIAGYLKHYGWRSDQTWGRAVTLPDGGEVSLKASQADGVAPQGTCKSFKSAGAWRSLGDWQALGVRRADGSDLPDVDISAALIMGDKGDGKAYIVYRNFCSIMRYNPAFKYALGVGLLSDQITGAE